MSAGLNERALDEAVRSRFQGWSLSVLCPGGHPGTFVYRLLSSERLEEIRAEYHRIVDERARERAMDAAVRHVVGEVDIKVLRYRAKHDLGWWDEDMWAIVKNPAVRAEFHRIRKEQLQ